MYRKKLVVAPVAIECLWFFMTVKVAVRSLAIKGLHKLSSMVVVLMGGGAGYWDAIPTNLITTNLKFVLRTDGLLLPSIVQRATNVLCLRPAFESDAATQLFSVSLRCHCSFINQHDVCCAFVVNLKRARNTRNQGAVNVEVRPRHSHLFGSVHTKRDAHHDNTPMLVSCLRHLPCIQHLMVCGWHTGL